MSDKVNLLVRSALCNGDRKMEAGLEWTVLEVKREIEKDWPSHPTPGDQRLVYAGKLLQDGSRLREVLRLEDLGQPYIVHLVCRQLSPPPVPVGDGLRRRNVATSSSSTSAPRSGASPTSSSSSPPATSATAAAASPWMQSYAGQFDGQAVALDQVGWPALSLLRRY